MPDSASSATPAPLDVFFTAFVGIAAGFTYRPKTAAHRNFAHLCKASGWAKHSPAHLNARQGFQDALVQEFNFIYGTDGNDLAAWHGLCDAIGIAPLPEDLDACRKRVWDAHVNIIDLVETVRTGRRVRQFGTLNELVDYTVRTERFFPKRNAYEGGLLKELLREIFNPYYGKRRNGSQKRKARKARKRREAVANSSQS